MLKKKRESQYYENDYEIDLNTIRLAIGLGILAIIHRHRDKSILKKFVKDASNHHVTGKALAAVGEPIHVFEGDPSKYNEKWIANRIKGKIRDGEEPNGVLVPPPEEIFENEENLRKLVDTLRWTIYEKYGILIPKEDIITAMKKAYNISKELAKKIRYLSKDKEKARKKLMEHPAFQEYIQFLQEFAGVKLKQPEPTIAQKRAQPVERIQTEERTIGTPANLTNAKLEVLSMLQALKLLNYSEEAVNNAIMDFKKKISEILKLEDPTPEDVYRLGLYYLALNYVREGKFEKAERLLERL